MVEEEKNENEEELGTPSDNTIDEAIQNAYFKHEEEEDADIGISYEINSYGADYDIEGIVRRFTQKSFYHPGFQRNYVWSKTQASKFIESILMGLPIPGLFLYKEKKTGKSFIVDGLQRISTLEGFRNGKFPKNGTKFKLTGLVDKEELNGKSYEDLAGSDKLKFSDTVIHIHFIEQMMPEDDHSAAFKIFDRLNSGGTPLQAQEMRNAIYEGNFQKTLI